MNDDVSLMTLGIKSGMKREEKLQNEKIMNLKTFLFSLRCMVVLSKC